MNKELEKLAKEFGTTPDKVFQELANHYQDKKKANDILEEK